MPKVLVAGSVVDGIVCTMVDGKVKRIGTGATLLVGVIESVCARGCVGGTIPCKAVSGRYGGG